MQWWMLLEFLGRLKKRRVSKDTQKDYFQMILSSLMAVPIYNVQGGSYIREGKVKVVGGMGSCSPWKKDDHAFKGKWEVTFLEGS